MQSPKRFVLPAIRDTLVVIGGKLLVSLTISLSGIAPSLQSFVVYRQVTGIAAASMAVNFLLFFLIACWGPKPRAIHLTAVAMLVWLFEGLFQVLPGHFTLQRWLMVAVIFAGNAIIAGVLSLLVVRPAKPQAPA